MHNYAVRRVNPFRGVMQVIDAEEGRALSCNGIVWEILVRATQGQTLGHPPGHTSPGINKKTYYRFGMWSMDDGLMKRANSPAEEEDYFSLVSKCETLTDYVRAHHSQLPFKLEDNLELWLFDNANLRPIALLSTLVTGASLPSPEPQDWTASIGANGSPSQRRFPHARELENQVSQRAGSNVNTCWIKRLPGGDGIIRSTGETITAGQFPVLLLDEDWDNKEDQERADAYIKWISPSLLTLQHLDAETRSRIENNLNVQAVSIEHHWHLYPEILDKKLVKAARVQNKIESCS